MRTQWSCPLSCILCELWKSTSHLCRQQIWWTQEEACTEWELSYNMLTTSAANEKNTRENKEVVARDSCQQTDNIQCPKSNDNYHDCSNLRSRISQKLRFEKGTLLQAMWHTAPLRLWSDHLRPFKLRPGYFIDLVCHCRIIHLWTAG